MTYEEVYNFYGSTRQFENRTPFTQQALSSWKKKGYIPIKSQIKLYEASNGALKPCLRDFEK